MKLLIRPSIALGAIVGAILGVILLIPYVQAISCFMYGFIGTGIVIYLKRNNFVGFLSVQDGALIGAVSGFISAITSSIVFIPIYYLINNIFNASGKTGFNLLTSLLTFSYSIFALIMIVFFVAMLSSLFNAFSALVVTYVFERIEGDNSNREEMNDILIDEQY